MAIAPDSLNYKRKSYAKFGKKFGPKLRPLSSETRKPTLTHKCVEALKIVTGIRGYLEVKDFGVAIMYIPIALYTHGNSLIKW